MHFLTYHLLTYRTDGLIQGTIIAIGLILASIAARLSIRNREPKKVVAWKLIKAALQTLLVLFLYGVYILFRQSVETSDGVICRNQLKTLGVALTTYVNNTGHYPPADSWDIALLKYIPQDKAESVFHCPASETPYSYRYNAAMSNVPIAKLTDLPQTVVIFEAKANHRDAVGSKADIDFGRHISLYTAYYLGADGFARRIEHNDDSLIWSP